MLTEQNLISYLMNLKFYCNNVINHIHSDSQMIHKMHAENFNLLRMLEIILKPFPFYSKLFFSYITSSFKNLRKISLKKYFHSHLSQVTSGDLDL